MMMGEGEGSNFIVITDLRQIIVLWPRVDRNRQLLGGCTWLKQNAKRTLSYCNFSHFPNRVQTTFFPIAMLVL
jgi:hypothetical protein